MSKLTKTTVELDAAARPSRIRRDPVRADKPQGLVGKVNFNTREWEIAQGIIGIVLFALALNAIWIGFTAWMSE
jgi:hypothetical protein